MRGEEQLSIWLPADWEIAEGFMYDLLALGPPEEPYRANLSIAHVTLDAGPASLQDLAQATATVQSNALETFLEYDRRSVELAGREAIQREYAWVQGATGLVLYQLEVLAQGAHPTQLLEVHATSAAPAYFRYAAVLRRMIESVAHTG